MSIRISSQVWGCDYKIGTMLTLLAMADYATHEGLCWPSVAMLAHKTRQSVRNVRRSLRLLERDRIISVECAHRQHRSRRYRIDCDAIRAKRAQTRLRPEQ